jgi:cellulose synthase/poly-beta-1,6-N-acetylglucosamine synthase-like glycosyltransferase
MERTLLPTYSRLAPYIYQAFDTADDGSQYTTQLSVDNTPQLVVPQANDANNLVPVQIIFIVKAKNQKKINSHRWLFNAVGRMLQVKLFFRGLLSTLKGPLAGDMCSD